MWGAKYPNRIEMQFCTGVDIREVVTPANFGSHRFRRFRMAGGRISGFSIDFQCRPYNTCDVPQIWRTAVVVPVFKIKKGVSSNADNYRPRPISLTCCCCKVMESIIKDHMLSFLLQHNLISKQQHGFLARRSTCTQLIECTNDWTLALNVRNSVDCIYIDFSRLRLLTLLFMINFVVSCLLMVLVANCFPGYMLFFMLGLLGFVLVAVCLNYAMQLVVCHREVYWTLFYSFCL